MTFWYWSRTWREWIEVDEHLIQGPELVSKREVFRRHGFCTAGRKVSA